MEEVSYWVVLSRQTSCASVLTTEKVEVQVRQAWYTLVYWLVRLVGGRWWEPQFAQRGWLYATFTHILFVNEEGRVKRNKVELFHALSL